MAEVKNSNKIITYGVAGSVSTRKLRAAVAELLFPRTDNWLNKATTGGAKQTFPLPLEMTGVKENVVKAAGAKPDNIEEVIGITSTENDQVLIIGQCCFKFFNTDCSPLLKDSYSSSVHSMGGSNPTDFNVTQDALSNYKNSKTITPSSECPLYTFPKWKEIIDHYPAVIKDIHNIAVGAFFTSRTATNDGAFYRQFDLANKPDIIRKFEKQVAKEVQIHNEFAKFKDSSLLADIIKHADDENTNWAYATDKTGGSEHAYKVFYEKWNTLLNADKSPQLMNPLSEIILKVLNDVRSNGAREYDGYAASCMLYLKAGAKLPTPEEHYNHLLHLFKNNSVPNEWITGLRAILNKGNLHVAHDLGLDPYVDDFIALKILRTTQDKLHLQHGGDGDNLYYYKYLKYKQKYLSLKKNF